MSVLPRTRQLTPSGKSLPVWLSNGCLSPKRCIGDLCLHACSKREYGDCGLLVLMVTITPEFSSFGSRRVECSVLRDPRVKSDPPYVSEEHESGNVLRTARTGRSNHSFRSKGALESSVGPKNREDWTGARTCTSAPVEPGICTDRSSAGFRRLPPTEMVRAFDGRLSQLDRKGNSI